MKKELKCVLWLYKFHTRNGNIVRYNHVLIKKNKQNNEKRMLEKHIPLNWTLSYNEEKSQIQLGLLRNA